MITIEEIEKLAALSRIELTNEEKTRFQKEIESILAYVGEIQELSGDEEKSKDSMTELHNVFREDENPHEGGIYSEALLSNAPRSEDGYFKVKKIL